MNRTSLFLIIFILFSFSLYGNEEQPFSFTPDLSGTLIGKKLQYATSLPAEWSALQVHNDGQFMQADAITLALGLHDHPVWVRLTLKNDSPLDEISLDIRYTQLDTVELYEIHQGEITYLGIQGDKVGRPRGSSLDVRPRFDIHLPKGEQRTYLFRITSNENIVIPVSVSAREDLDRRDQRNNLLFGLYAGIMLVMFLYNLVVFLIVKDKSYLFYIIYIFSIGMAQGSITGYSKVFLWPGSVEFHQFSVVFFSVLAGLGALTFLQQFLHLKENAPRLNKLLKVFLGIYVLALIGYLFGQPKLTFSLLDLGGIAAAIFAFSTAAYLTIKGNRSARFYLVAWTFFLSGLIVFVLRMLGVLPYNFFTENAIQIGSATEAILLSIALADRINVLKKEKEKSQIEALQASLENERIIREQNVMLETKVQERTYELSIANHEISKALKDLQETQTQLVESEKMASLGQLTAGVAHEINNPINFVSANIKPLERDFQDILSIIQKYDECADESVKESINKYKRELDFDYLKEEISMLLKGIQEGANRTVEIVHSLRNFSRLDEQDLKRADVHDGIDSTLVLLNSSMGGIIHINKQYGDIPEIDCYPGKLNQVFMNILSNSVYALKNKFDGQSGGEITISTSQDENNIQISIKDNGIGMPKEVMSKIFDPFYTSKPVGEGTGLGLSIVYKIIENHKGQIKVDSCEGEWTEFIITLPKYSES